MTQWNFARELAHYGPHNPSVATVGLARDYCKSVATSHYENFTLASWLLPKTLRPHFYAVYAWCRWADDLADETDDSLNLLSWWQEELHAAYEAEPRHAVTVALAQTVKQFQIPRQLFERLLHAFRQDQRVNRYETFPQLLNYCCNSANPVGQIVLRLFECFDAENSRLSDEVCTGLQLSNFWQDVVRDSKIGRVYLPQEDIVRYGLTPSLIEFEVQRTRPFFERGEALLPRLPRKAGMDVELFLRGGEAVLDAIARQKYDVWTRRPVVTKWKKMRLMIDAMLKQPRRTVHRSAKPRG